MREYHVRFCERLGLKCPCLLDYLHAYADGTALYQGLKTYFDFYNRERFHQNMAYQTPQSIYQLAA
jgi:putative transposase